MVAVWFYYQDDGRNHALHDIAHYLVHSTELHISWEACRKVLLIYNRLTSPYRYKKDIICVDI